MFFFFVFFFFLLLLLFFFFFFLYVCLFVSGVTVHRSSGDINIFAKRIISDAGVINTLKHLLPRHVAQNSCK